MAKINLTANHNNQENLGAIASLGVLMCMVVTIVGIKLWWFKQRLSFEPNGTQNGTANGATMPVIVPRRNRQARYKKDKRYSQQIYDSGVEGHGVFRKKDEDDLDIQSPKQLPPIRLQQPYGSTSSLILPPPRSKRNDRKQIHSTAFEDLEITSPTTPILATTSSSDLTAIKRSDTKLNLTFEEFEKQFKFKELNAEFPADNSPTTNTEVIELPVPALRLNRSSSALTKPERTQTCYLKSSQSMAIPEAQKIREKRPTGFSRFAEDLTKIDDYEEAKLFETFGERKSTGYIRYEEVDRDLQEEYERELNESLEVKMSDPFKDEEIQKKNIQEISALEALKHERIIYHNDINESPDFHPNENWNFNLRTFQFKSNDIEFTEDDFKAFTDKENARLKALQEQHSDKVPAPEYNSVQITEIDEQPHYTNVKSMSEYRSVKERRPTDFFKDKEPSSEAKILENVIALSTKEERKATELIKEPLAVALKVDESPSEFQSVKDRRPTKFVNKSITDDLLDLEDSGVQDEEAITEFRSVKDRRPTKFVSDSTADDVLPDLEDSGTQDEEAITEFRSVKDRRPTKFVRDSTADDSPYLEDFGVQDEKSVTEFRSVKDRRPTKFVSDSFTDMTHSSEEKKSEVPPSYFEPANEQEFKSINEHRTTEFVKDSTKKDLLNVKPSGGQNVNSLQFETANRQNDIDNQSDSWPQFEEEIDIPKVNVTKFNQHDFESQSSVEEAAENFETSRNVKQKPTISFEMPEKNGQSKEKFTLNQRRPTGYIRNWPESPDLDETEQLWQQENSKSQKHYYSQIRSLMTSETNHNNSTYSTTQIEQREVKFAPQTLTNAETEDEDKDSPIKQRRPTGFVRKEHYTVSYSDDTDSEDNTETKTASARNNVEIIELQEIWNDMDVEEHTNTQVSFDKATDFNDEKDTWNDNIKQRRPTGYIKTQETLDFPDEKEHLAAVKQRRPTDFEKQISVYDEEIYEYELERKEIPLSPTVRFEEMDDMFKDNEGNQNSLIKQRRPTGFVRKNEIENMEKQVNFKLEDEKHEDKKQEENEALKQRRPTGYVKKPDLTFLEQPPPIYQQPTSQQHSPDFDDSLWREMEKDIQEMQSPHIDEEFAKIRHSYERNEGDFLEQKSPFNSAQKPRGFGKSIEEDWENFEKLKTNEANKSLESPQEIQIIYAREEMTTITSTTSILKDPKTEEETQVKPPRKSKVTFDFKTEEHLIPARTICNDFEHNSDYDDDDVYDTPPPPVPPPPPPQPMQRLSKINYNQNNSHLSPIVTTPSKISLFGSQISPDEEAEEDSWSVIRKHRNLTEEFQNLSPSSASNTPPPKPTYRNPMAQLAIQRAKEVRADMDGFKSRSINDRKPAALRRQRQQILNLNYDDGTDA